MSVFNTNRIIHLLALTEVESKMKIGKYLILIGWQKIFKIAKYNLNNPYNKRICLRLGFMQVDIFYL